MSAAPRRPSSTKSDFEAGRMLFIRAQHNASVAARRAFNIRPLYGDSMELGQALTGHFGVCAARRKQTRCIEVHIAPRG